MSTSFPADTWLRPGQTLRLPVDAGTSILVAEGAVRVDEAAVWLGETMAASGRTCREGEVYRAERSGWIALCALGEVRLRAVPELPEPSAAARASPVARFVRLLTG